jgi:hypothetical protein
MFVAIEAVPANVPVARDPLRASTPFVVAGVCVVQILLAEAVASGPTDTTIGRIVGYPAFDILRMQGQLAPTQIVKS